MATMKLYEIGTVPVITKALKMCINNPHKTWEARQLFLLTSTLGKKRSDLRDAPQDLFAQPRTSCVRHYMELYQTRWLWEGRVADILKSPQLGAADAPLRLR